MIEDAYFLLPMQSFDPDDPANARYHVKVAIGRGSDFLLDPDHMLDCESAHEHGSNSTIQPNDQCARLTYDADGNIPSPDVEYVHLSCLFEDADNALVPVNAIDNLYPRVPTCGVHRDFGPAHDLTRVSCDLPNDHLADHEGLFYPEVRVTWPNKRRY